MTVWWSRTTVRRLVSDLGGHRVGCPPTRWTVWLTRRMPWVRSMSHQRRPAVSARRSPRTAMRWNAACPDSRTCKLDAGLGGGAGRGFRALARRDDRSAYATAVRMVSLFTVMPRHVGAAAPAIEEQAGLGVEGRAGAVRGERSIAGHVPRRGPFGVNGQVPGGDRGAQQAETGMDPGRIRRFSRWPGCVDSQGGVRSRVWCPFHSGSKGIRVLV